MKKHGARYMKSIRLTTNNGEREVLVNWDNVDFAKNTVNHFNDEYTEIYYANQVVGVKETLAEIEIKLAKIS